MKVALTGASGLIGSALAKSLVDDGHEVMRLVRRPPSSADEVQWDPKSGSVDVAGLTGTDALLHFAGAGVGDRRWTAAYKREIRESRVLGTQTIARAVAGLDPRPSVMVCGSAIGFYGDTGDEEVDESSPNGDGFLAGVVRDWENAAGPARDSGIRVVHPRSGLVVAAKGGAWGRLWPLFRLGVGGKLGGGHQYWSFVSARDEVRAIRRMIDDTSMSGAYNVCAPNAATNAEVTHAMGALLHRPTIAPVPSFVLKAVLGEMSSEVLGSIRVRPARLLEAGFTFSDPTIHDALAAALEPPPD
jgi:uncharacterized protein (TIGR01777 family)